MDKKATSLRLLTGPIQAAFNAMDPLPSGKTEQDRQKHLAQSLHRSSREWLVKSNEIQDLKYKLGRLEAQSSDETTNGAAEKLSDEIAVAQDAMDTELNEVVSAEWHICWLTHVAVGLGSEAPLSCLVRTPVAKKAGGSSRATQRAKARRASSSPMMSLEDEPLLRRLDIREERQLKATRFQEAVDVYNTEMASARDLHEIARISLDSDLQGHREIMKVLSEIGFDEDGATVTSDTKLRWVREYKAMLQKGSEIDQIFHDSVAASSERFNRVRDELAAADDCGLRYKNEEQDGTSSSEIVDPTLAAYTVKRKEHIETALRREGRNGWTQEDVRKRAKLEWMALPEDKKRQHTKEATNVARKGTREAMEKAELQRSAKATEKKTRKAQRVLKNAAGAACGTENPVSKRKASASRALSPEALLLQTHSSTARNMPDGSNTTTPSAAPAASSFVCGVCNIQGEDDLLFATCAGPDCSTQVHSTRGRPTTCFPIAAKFQSAFEPSWFCGTPCATTAIKIAAHGAQLVCASCSLPVSQDAWKLCKVCDRPVHADTVKHPNPAGCESLQGGAFSAAPMDIVSRACNRNRTGSHCRYHCRPCSPPRRPATVPQAVRCSAQLRLCRMQDEAALTAQQPLYSRLCWRKTW